MLLDVEVAFNCLGEAIDLVVITNLSLAQPVMKHRLYLNFLINRLLLLLQVLRVLALFDDWHIFHKLIEIRGPFAHPRQSLPFTILTTFQVKVADVGREVKLLLVFCGVEPDSYLTYLTEVLLRLILGNIVKVIVIIGALVIQSRSQQV